LNLTEIISQCKTENSKAEKALFLRFAPRVLTLCRRYTSNKVDAQDVTQECFIRIFEKIKQYDSEKGAFEGWLHRLCINVILTKLKTSKRKIDLVYPGELPEQEITRIDIARVSEEEILKAVQQLPVGYRQVFNLFPFEGWTHKEIGKELEIAETTSRSQLTRARKFLKAILQNKMDQDYERKLA